MSHTPGPWHIEWGTDHDEGRVYGIYAANGERIVETDTSVYPPSANDARLITAAPDMLAALKAVIEHGYFGVEPQVKAAIAKAEGSAQR